jgi:hypothetical protein
MPKIFFGRFGGDANGEGECARGSDYINMMLLTRTEFDGRSLQYV